jgi:hypothetical protein
MPCLRLYVCLQLPNTMQGRGQKETHLPKSRRFHVYLNVCLQGHDALRRLISQDRYAVRHLVCTAQRDSASIHPQAKQEQHRSKTLSPMSQPPDGNILYSLQWQSMQDRLLLPHRRLLLFPFQSFHPNRNEPDHHCPHCAL